MLHIDVMNESDAPIHAATRRLAAAARSGTPCQPVRDLLGNTDIALAYRVQELLNRDRMAGGARVVGRKIGLTSPAVQKQLGVDQPDFGVLFDDMKYRSGDRIPCARLLQPKVEGEIAFILSEDIVGKTLDESRVRAAIEYAVPALEIVDSRVRDWDIKITDTVADNASSGLFVLGEQATKLTDFDPVAVSMELRNGETVVSTGTGADCLGNPVTAMLWLARTAQEYGSPLRAGDVVLSGALGPMVPVKSGSTVTATFTSLGEVSATFPRKDNR